MLRAGCTSFVWLCCPPVNRGYLFHGASHQPPACPVPGAFCLLSVFVLLTGWTADASVGAQMAESIHQHCHRLLTPYAGL